MRTFRFVILVSFLLVVGLVLAACAGLGQSQSAEGKTVIHVAGGAVGQELDQTRKGAENYMAEHPDVRVVVDVLPDSTTDRFFYYLDFFESQSPELDVLQIDVIWPGEIASHLVDLNQYGAQEVADKHFQRIIENNTVDGRLVGIPWFTDAGVLYYRTDLLEKYGYNSPPESWADLEEMARVIQDGERGEGNQNFWGYVWQGDMYEGLTCDGLEWVASDGGGTIVNDQKQITINNPQAADALQQAAGWVDEISPPDVTEYQEEDARLTWQAGNAAFMRNWPYAYSLGNAPDSPVRDKFDVAPLPAGAGGQSASCLGGWQLAVSKYSDHPDVAADVALFLASEPEQKRRAVEASLNPTIEGLYQDEDVLQAVPFFGRLYDVFTNAVARPSAEVGENYQEASRIFYTRTHDVLTGNMEAQTAVQEMEVDLQAVLGFETGNP